MRTGIQNLTFARASYDFLQKARNKISSSLVILTQCIHIKGKVLPSFN